MKDARDYLDFLFDILEYTEKGSRIVDGIDFETFQSEEDKMLSGTYVIMVIGEAVKQLPPALTDRYPDVPWREIARMRDRLIHAYFVIDQEVVWSTLIRDLPKLRLHIKAIMDELMIEERNKR